MSNIFRKSVWYRYISLIFALSLLSTALFLLLFGFRIENKIRYIYRAHICHCDTLRIKTIFDENGVPQVNYYSVYGFPVGLQTNPSIIAFATEDYLKENTIASKEKFFNCIKKLDQIQELRDTAIFFNYNFDWIYGLNAPWNSGMAQGNILKAYTMAFELSKDPAYLSTAFQIRNSFLVPVEKKGVTYFFNENENWYEEYAQPNGEKPMILNGMMYALDGLHYFAQATNDSLTNVLFNKGIAALKNNLHKYDDETKSKYDIKGKVASDHYHQVHIDFLNKFYKITGIKEFKKYADKWSVYQPDNYLYKLFFNPNKASVTLAISMLIFFYGVFFLLKKTIKCE